MPVGYCALRVGNVERHLVGCLGQKWPERRASAGVSIIDELFLYYLAIGERWATVKICWQKSRNKARLRMELKSLSRWKTSSTATTISDQLAAIWETNSRLLRSFTVF